MFNATEIIESIGESVNSPFSDYLRLSEHLTTNLVIHDTVKDEDEDALQAVQDRKDIGHNDRLFINVE